MGREAEGRHRGCTYGGKVRRRKRENSAPEGTKGKKGRRVFSLENRVNMRLSMKNEKSVYLYICVYVCFRISEYVCVCCVPICERRKEYL